MRCVFTDGLYLCYLSSSVGRTILRREGRELIPWRCLCFYINIGRVGWITFWNQSFYGDGLMNLWNFHGFANVINLATNQLWSSLLDFAMNIFSLYPATFHNLQFAPSISMCTHKGEHRILNNFSRIILNFSHTDTGLGGSSVEPNAPSYSKFQTKRGYQESFHFFL